MFLKVEKRCYTSVGDTAEILTKEIRDADPDTAGLATLEPTTKLSSLCGSTTETIDRTDVHVIKLKYNTTNYVQTDPDPDVSPCGVWVDVGFCSFLFMC